MKVYIIPKCSAQKTCVSDYFLSKLGAEGRRGEWGEWLTDNLRM